MLSILEKLGNIFGTQATHFYVKTITTRVFFMQT